MRGGGGCFDWGESERKAFVAGGLRTFWWVFWRMGWGKTWGWSGLWGDGDRPRLAGKRGDGWWGGLGDVVVATAAEGGEGAEEEEGEGGGFGDEGEGFAW